MQDALRRCRQAPWFTDITAESGLADIDGNIRVVAADVDGDGLPDLLVHGGVSARDSLAAPKKRLFLNRGAGHFEDVTAASGLLDSRDGPGTGRLANLAVFADVDNDGDLDIFSGTFIDENTDPVAASKDRSEILLNDGKGHFTFAPRSKPSSKALPTAAAVVAATTTATGSSTSSSAPSTTAPRAAAATSTRARATARSAT